MRQMHYSAGGGSRLGRAAVEECAHVEHRKHAVFSRHECRKLAVPVLGVGIGDQGVCQGLGDLAVRLRLRLGAGLQLIGVGVRFDLF